MNDVSLESALATIGDFANANGITGRQLLDTMGEALVAHNLTHPDARWSPMVLHTVCESGS